MGKVSVIIPVYNRATMLGDALDSVLSQTYKDIEIIIVDDGSTDDTSSAVERYMIRYPEKFRYFYQKNSGPAAARNTGIRMSQGVYVAFLDSDDVWHPEKLKRTIELLETGNADWACTACHRDYGSRIEIRRIQDRFLSNDAGRIELLKGGLFFFSDVPLYLPSVLAKKSCFDMAGLFDESYKIGEDTDMWLRFEEAGLVGGYINEPLFTYRVSDNNITKTGKIDGLAEHVRLARKHALILGLKKPLIRKSYGQFLWDAAVCYLLKRQLRKALKYAIVSIYYKPDITKLSKLLKFKSRERK